MPESVSDLKKKLSTVKIGEATYWVAEGDLLLDEDGLASYSKGGQANAVLPTAGTPYELVASTDGDGRVYRWSHAKELTYAIVKSSFDASEYATMAANMKQATFDWEGVCGVKFRHDSSKDSDASPAGVLFTVRKIDTGGKFIAAAFFPQDPVSRRVVVIDPTYFKTDFDKVGVLRHELGHVLGFRHEHIRSLAPPDCPKESTANTLDLNDYDPQSVMHYFCGGMGSKKLAITDKDVEAAQRLYGFPIGQVRYVD